MSHNSTASNSPDALKDDWTSVTDPSERERFKIVSRSGSFEKRFENNERTRSGRQTTPDTLQRPTHLRNPTRSTEHTTADPHGAAYLCNTYSQSVACGSNRRNQAMLRCTTRQQHRRQAEVVRDWDYTSPTGTLEAAPLYGPLGGRDQMVLRVLEACWTGSYESAWHGYMSPIPTTWVSEVIATTWVDDSTSATRSYDSITTTRAACWT